MDFLDNSLKELSSLKIGGQAKYVISIKSESDLVEAINFAKEKELPFQILGHGTNTIFKSEEYNLVVGLMQISGIHIVRDFGESVMIKVGAGVLWDDFVAFCVENNFAGIEALSAIPGTVGASPVQNIGAYGTEVSQTFVNAKVFDLQLNDFKILGLNECNFSYRDSIFKENPGKYIITEVTFELKKIGSDTKNSNQVKVPEYKDVQIYFLGKKTATLSEIRQAIIQIRSRKLPDPKEIPNSGSFFKNPIVDEAKISELISKYPKIPFHQNTDEQGLKSFKIYAGWLLEEAGFKGHDFGKIICYPNNALVLTNPKNATFLDLEKNINEIKQRVIRDFGIGLEIEPNII